MKSFVSIAGILALCLGASACKVSETKEAKLPSVDVKATGGQMPAYDVKGPEVKVGSKTETITVPTVKVKAPN